jgi:hypothetical protein
METKKQDKNSQILKCGKRTYFFDLKEASNGNKYLKISESTFVKEGEPRKRNTFILFKDDVKEFVKTIKSLESTL